MSSIDNRNIICTILKNGGVYPDDPPCQTVYRYENAWGGTTYKLCYNESQEENFLVHGNYRSCTCLFRDGELTVDGKTFVEANDYS